MVDIELPMDPDLEAFFVAVALEMGTNPSSPYDVTSTIRHVTDFLAAREYMKAHPGAPAVIEKLRRAHYEMGGANPMSRYVDATGGTMVVDERFWNWIVTTYGQWLAQQKQG